MRKTLKITAISILAIILLLIIVNQFVNRSIKTEIVIDARVEIVWATLLDHQSYSEWNPFIKKISGSTKEGNNLAVLQSESSSVSGESAKYNLNLEIGLGS